MPSESLGRLAIDKSRSGSPAGTGRVKIVIAVVCILAGIVILYLLHGRAVSIETTTVNQVYPTQSFTLLNASGYVVAQRKAAVAAKTTGRLEWLGVEEGSHVQSGQVIARLENKDLQSLVKQAEAVLASSRAVLEQAKAELNDARLAFGRQKDLLVQGIVAQADYDSAEARFKRAVASVSGAEAGVNSSSAALTAASVNLDYSLIRAPFDGVVLTKNADVGDIITPLGAAANAKAAVVTIADLASLQVEVDVSESSLAQVRNGQPCEITLDALPGARFRGQVHTVVPTADRSKASIMVKIRFVDSDRRILPEMGAKAAFLEREASRSDQQPHIAINPAAIVKSDGRDGVYLVKDNRVIFTPVTRGISLGDMVEVSGVKPGDKLALKPLNKLKDGIRIVLASSK